MPKPLLWLRTAQIALDAGLLYAAWLLAYGLRVGFFFSTDFPFPPYAGAALLGTAATVLTWLSLGRYSLPLGSWWRRGWQVAVGLGAGVALVILLYYFQRQLFFSRLLLLMVLGGAGVLLALSEWALRWLVARARATGRYGHRTLVVGANRTTESLLRQISTDPHCLHRVIGVIDPYGVAQSVAGAPLLGKLNQLESAVSQHRVTSIVQTDGFEHTLSLIGLCQQHDLKYQFVPALRGVPDDNIRIRKLAYTPVISFVERTDGRRGWYRLVDWALRDVLGVD